MKIGLLKHLRPFFYAFIGLALGGVLAMVVGEDPVHVFNIMMSGVVNTPYDLGNCLYYLTVLIFAGLAVAIPYQAGVFNIGGEGQLVMGAITAALTGLWWGPEASPLVGAVVGVLAAFAGGAVWGGIAGWIRAYRGGHEVISSIMLNFIAAGLSGWLVVHHFRALDSQNPETALLGDSWRWTKLAIFDGAPVTMLSFLAVMSAILCWVLLTKMTFGFKVKATMEAPKASRLAGIETKRIQLAVMLGGGGLAGLAGGVMVLASAGRFRLDMGEGFGFMGIPVALLGKGSPLGVIFSAGLFAFLQQGASALDLEATRVNRDFAQVIQALVVLVVVSERLFDRSFWQNLAKSFSQSIASHGKKEPPRGLD